MTPQHHEIRRRADGSIDTGFYVARAVRLRAAADAAIGRRLAALLARLVRRAACWRAWCGVRAASARGRFTFPPGKA